MPSMLVAEDQPTLQETLEVQRLQFRATRLEQVLAALRDRARVRAGAGPVPLPLSQAIQGFEEELRKTRRQLRREPLL